MSLPDAGTIATLPDPRALDAAATAFTAVARRYGDVIGGVTTAWNRFGAPRVFETPDTAELLGKLRGPHVMEQVLQQQCRQIEGALSGYASTVQSLQAQRDRLLADLGTAADAEQQVQAADPATTAHRLRDEEEAAAALRQRVAAFNAAAEAADADCARALRALGRFPSIGAERVAQDLSQGDLIVSLAEGTLKRLRHLPYAAPGTPLPDPAPVRPDAVEFHNRTYLPDRNGLLLPEGLVDDGSGYADQVTTKNHVFLTETEDAAEHMAPKLAKLGGHALGALGIVVTYGATYADEQQQLTAEHPDWSEDKRNGEALTSTAVKGTFSWGGAAAGAAAGAALGSFIPGPGNLIGALVGGMIGGMAGEWAGDQVDDARKAAER